VSWDLAGAVRKPYTYVLRLVYIDERPEVPVEVADTIVCAGWTMDEVVAEWVSDYASPTASGGFWTPKPEVDVIAVVDTEGNDYQLIDRQTREPQ
jgi:hypothetical protein